MTDDFPMPPDLAASPLAARIAAFLRHVRGGGVELTDGEIAGTWSATFPGVPLLRESFARWKDQTFGCVVIGYEQPQPLAAAAMLRGADGREWRACVAIDEQPPHVMLASVVFPAPPGVIARPAAAGDAAAMREVERRTPIVIDNVQVAYDRGEDYLAGERLMGGDTEMFVMERDRQIVGFGGRAFPSIRVAGVVYQGLYSHRLRLLPEAQGEGVQGPMNALRMMSGAGKRLMGYAFVAVGNEAAMRSLPAREAAWPALASRILLDTKAVAKTSRARTAGPSDAVRLVELFNATHHHEELFVPYTVDSLSTRLQRAPELYSWRDVLMGERAAVGVWSARLGVHREDDGVVTDDVRALVLDFGCEPGAESELLALIAGRCRELHASGTTELSIFSTPPSPLFLMLSSIAKRVEPYLVRCAAAPGPALDQRGVYVDQLYF